MVIADKRTDDHIERFVRQIDVILLEKFDSLIAIKHTANDGLGWKESGYYLDCKRKLKASLRFIIWTLMKLTVDLVPMSFTSCERVENFL